MFTSPHVTGPIVDVEMTNDPGTGRVTPHNTNCITSTGKTINGYFLVALVFKWRTYSDFFAPLSGIGLKV